MNEPKLEVPAEFRYLAEKTIEQAEKAFGMFFDAANKSMASIPHPATEVPKKALSFTEQKMKAAFVPMRGTFSAANRRVGNPVAMMPVANAPINSRRSMALCLRDEMAVYPSDDNIGKRLAS